MRIRGRKDGAVIGVVLLGMTNVTPAFADETAACEAAVSKGQELRDAHKLVEAREQFRICAAPACPAVMRSDCTNWIDEADRAIPTVVLSAKDASGDDLLDVSVSLDGAPLTAKLD